MTTFISTRTPIILGDGLQITGMVTPANDRWSFMIPDHSTSLTLGADGSGLATSADAGIVPVSSGVTSHTLVQPWSISYTSTNDSQLDGWHYGNLFFERYHVFPASEDLGTILSDTQSSFQVHNAFRELHDTLNDLTIGGTGGEGTTVTLSISGEDYSTALPLLLQALRSHKFDFTVLGSGASTFDISITPVMASAQFFPSFNVTGSRALVFPFIPQRPVSENIQFMTSVLTSKDGTENRLAERKNARQSFNMKYLIDQQDPQMYQNAQAIGGWYVAPDPQANLVSRCIRHRSSAGYRGPRLPRRRVRALVERLESN